MAVAGRYLLKCADELFPDQADREAFLSTILQQPHFSKALVWTKQRPDVLPFSFQPRFDWQPSFVDRLDDANSAGAHQLHQEGYYYVLDFSSILEASVLLAVSDSRLSEHPLTVLDACSSPGGKAIFASCLLKPGTLLCNEVIGKRSAALISNLKRCAVPRSAVIRYDPSQLGLLLASQVDVAIVDAPCSGQSLLVKRKNKGGAFHPVTVNMNAKRQRRILAQVSSTVRPGGFLAYMTCTYAKEENEEIISWFVRKFPSFRPVEVASLRSFLSRSATFPCYRLWPQSGLGAGGFGAILKNSEAAEPTAEPSEVFRSWGNELRYVWCSNDWN